MFNKIIAFIAAFWIAFVGFLMGCGNGKKVEPPVTEPILSVEETEETKNTAEPTTLVNDTDLVVKFIDVGQADAILITCGSTAMLIDGGNSADSNLIYTVLKKNNIDMLEYLVATHAHEDHIGGLPGAMKACTVKKVLSPVLAYKSKAFENFLKAVNEQGVSITIPKVGETFYLGESRIDVLGPCKEYEDVNETSIILKLTYDETSFLFTGDAGYDSEHDIIDAGFDLSATVLKVGHHGSSGSSSYVFLREIMPEYAVISVGADNEYGHPTDATLSRLRDADAKVLRTDMQGDITFTSDGHVVKYTVDKNSAVETNPTEKTTASEYLYVGNVKNGKLHRIACSSLPAENNRAYFCSIEEAHLAGYTDTCGICKP